MAKLKVSRSFVKEAHENACSTWKLRIEKEFPELFEKKEDFKVGDWVFFESFLSKEKVARIIENDSSTPHTCYAVDVPFNDWGGLNIQKNQTRKATKEEVEKHLIEEAKKRGFKEGVIIDNKNIYSCGDQSVTTSNEILFGHSVENMLEMWVGRNLETIYKEGKWAEIIPTMTKEEAEAELNCKIV